MASPLTNLSDIISSTGSINSDVVRNEEAIQRSIQLRRDLTKYRLRYIFRQPCSVFCKSVLSRIPSGKQVYLILVMLALEQIAYSTTSDYLIYPFIIKIMKVDDHYQILVRAMVMYIIADLLFPVMGWIADAWVGQYQMIHGSLWVMWLGYAGMAVMYSFSYYLWIYALLPFFFAVISCGHAGFQSCAIPFGANIMIKYRTTQELSSYFYFYYWIRNFGLISYVLSSTCDGVGEPLSAIIAVLTSVFCISLALILNGCCKSWFVINRDRPNPLMKILRVVYLAVVIKRPVHRSAFSFNGALPPSRIDLTKAVHGGKFTNEEVEDVKTSLRLLLMLIFILSFLIVYTVALQVMPLQLYDMNSTIINQHPHLGLLGEYHFLDKIVLAVNILLVLIFIPLLNSILYPFLREYMPNMVKRIGLGSILAVLAQISMLIISGVGSRFRTDTQQCALSNFTAMHTEMQSKYAYSHVSEYYLLIPLLLITLAEILINVTSLEFFYAQSPHQMRGMMIGFFFFTWGVASAVSQTLITVFGFIQFVSPMTCDFWYHLLCLFIVVLGAIGYAAMACGYKNRQRGETESGLFYRQQYS